MKVLALNGSHNPKGVTCHAIKLVGEELQKENIGLDIVHVGSKPIAGCINCRKCRTNGHHCVQNDIVNRIIDMLPNYDGLILGCPVHFMGMPGIFKACLDRLFYATENLKDWGLKPAAAITVCRRAGSVNTALQLGSYLNCTNLLTVNSQYWNVVFGVTPEEFLEQDKEGIQTMHVLGRNMTWLLNVISVTKDTFPAPQFI